MRRALTWLLVTVAIVAGLPVAVLVWIALVIELARHGLMPY